MSTADGKHTGLPEDYSTTHRIEKDLVGDMTLAANLALTNQYRRLLRLDPGGAHRDVTLPAEALSNGLEFEILNTADAAENLVIKSDAPATIVTISQNEKCRIACDGTTWYHMGIQTIALA